jgi:hypothetical protein
MLLTAGADRHWRIDTGFDPLAAAGNLVGKRAVTSCG